MNISNIRATQADLKKDADVAQAAVKEAQAAFEAAQADAAQAAEKLQQFEAMFKDMLGGKDEAPQAPAKRRGRPPKNPSATVEAASTPKRRGRPPKNPSATVEAASTPKRRGRPPKNPSTTVEAASTPKRRGRPPKNPVTTDQSKPETAKSKPAGDNARAAKGRDEVARGVRPPVKDAMATVMGTKTMNAAEITDLLKARGWTPNSDDPRTYIAYLLSSHKERFERVPVKGRGFYRVRTGSTEADTKSKAKPEVKAKPKSEAKPEAKAKKQAAPVGDKTKSSTDMILDEAGVGAGAEFGTGG